jgi:single-stranded DNA-binding protein
MPFCLVAGIVVAKPMVERFPKTGRPRAQITVRCDGSVAELFKIVAFDDAMSELEVLRPNDSVAIQGHLERELAQDRDGKTVTVGFRVVAKQVLALARRSLNKLNAYS